MIENANINTAENICVCSKCNELFRLSELLDQVNNNEVENLLEYPPKGILINNNFGDIKISIFTRSPGSIFLILFSLFFSGISFFGFFQTVITKSLFGSIFMLVFVVCSIYLWVRVFFFIFGKIVINKYENNQDYIFIGIGIIGKKHYLNWDIITNFHEHTDIYSEGGSSKKLYISEGNKLIKIPLDYLNDNKKRFLLMILKYFWNKNKNFD
jgi:hypothetical protein